MKRTLEILFELERGGVVSRHAIGGAMAATFYVEPLLTFDLDVFVLLPRTAGGLLTLTPLYEALRARGYATASSRRRCGRRARSRTRMREPGCFGSSIWRRFACRPAGKWREWT